MMIWITSAVSSAQLVIVRKKVKVVKVDTNRDRIEITGVDDPMRTIGYVHVYDKTDVTWNGRSYPWYKIRPGWIIGIKGGLRWDGHINAKEIEILKTN